MSSEGKDAPVVEEHSEKSLDAGDRADDLALSAADERRLKRKIDWNIVPYCSLLYLLSASEPAAGVRAPFCSHAPPRLSRPRQHRPGAHCRPRG